ncbi:MAG: HAMP domain-containing histidine kinase [Chloroflexota bacterium]|nr:MAG: HAMP domain-containing histidine kinase [Chloroflexota bacterium]
MSIRLRLALWYTAVLGGTLVIFSLLLYLLMLRHLIDEGDANIASRAQHIASTVRVETAAPSTVQRVELPPIDAFESPGIYVQVVQTNGTVVAHSDNLGGQELPGDERAFAVAHAGHGVFYTAIVAGEQVRVYVEPLVASGRVIGFVQVGRSHAEAYVVLDRLRLGLAGVGMVSLLLAGAIAWAVAGGALRPIASMTQTARAIALSRGFSRRLGVTTSRDELGQLSRTFNEMLASLEEAYATQQRFIADASHELRTPLTAVRANLELLDRQGADLPGSERQALITAATGEADRMARLVADLLSLARADAGQKLRMRPIELDRLLLEVYGDARLLAKGLTMAIREIDEASLLGDPDRLKQLILILVDNAIRYTPAGGEVGLSLRKDGATAVLEVSDTGIGISAQDMPHVFERFFRADRARARDAAGTGLGLAIAKWIIEEHGGDITVESELGKGSTFAVRLPLMSH